SACTSSTWLPSKRNRLCASDGAGRGQRQGPFAPAVLTSGRAAAPGARCAPSSAGLPTRGIVIHDLIKGLLIMRHSLDYDLRGRSGATSAAVIGRGRDVPGGAFVPPLTVDVFFGGETFRYVPQTVLAARPQE